MSIPTTHLTQGVRTYEAILAHGLEAVAADELVRVFGSRVSVLLASAPGSLRFQYAGNPKDVLVLGTVIAVSLVRHFRVPRPRGLLGDEHLRALFSDIETARSLHPDGAFRTLAVSAAGADSPVMTRLIATLASRTGLAAQSVGDLQIRLRRSPDGAGWETLTRLSPRPLSTRAWRVCNREGALDASVAQAMVQLTQPAAGDVFVNPCCGSGTLLIERLTYLPARRVIGCDISREGLQCAERNISAAGRTGAIELGEWDARAIPLPDAIADALCADLPFGTRVGSHGDNVTLYPDILREAARIARPGARYCVLTGEMRLMTDLMEASPHWTLAQLIRLRLAGIVPGLFVLVRR